MKNNLPLAFPHGVQTDGLPNPAIRLFGRRFYIDQTLPELLIEFLSVAQSKKRIGDSHTLTEDPFPEIDQIRSWPHAEKLAYRPIIRLNLKLFSFLSSSRIDTRHKIHLDQYRRLWEELKNSIHSGQHDSDQVIEWIEELLRGFKGAGFNRTWCAQSFFPIATNFLTPETIWAETKARKNEVDSWRMSIESLKTYYRISNHNFMARGGEVLYLQICNVFSREEKQIKEFSGIINLSDEEKELEFIHRRLQLGVSSLYGRHDLVLNELVNFIEHSDPETKDTTDLKSDYVTCEWCPVDSWKEGFLFSVELGRLLDTSLDPVEKLELMMTGCVLQVLRSICAQAIRYTADETDIIDQTRGGALSYAWIFTPLHGASRHLTLSSQRNLQSILTIIQKSIRTEALLKYMEAIYKQTPGNLKRSIDKELNEADNKYGFKLFRSIGKKLGIIVPYTGPGARFVMTDNLLRYFVITLLQPGESSTYEEFLDRLYNHYGIAVERTNLLDSLRWNRLPSNLAAEHSDTPWMREMLRAGGFLTELSDGYSIVTNTFSRIND